MTGVPKNIQIRNVPDDVHQELTERAAAVGKSLQEYLLGRLTVEARKKVNREILEETRKDMKEHPGEYATDVDIAAIIREDREAH